MECIGHLEGTNTLVFELCVENLVASEYTGGGYKPPSYAFYVFHNGERIVTRWYETSNKIEVETIGEGLYYAVGFVKIGEDNPQIFKSLPIQIIKCREKFYLPAVSVSIFGSCVSRDCLEYDAARNVILDLYFARQSIISTVSDKVSLCWNDIHSKSNFQKKQIYYDFNKTAFEMMQNKVSDFILIDLVDERFPLIKIDNSYVTRSDELLESGVDIDHYAVIDKEEYINESGGVSYKLEGIDIEAYLDKFCEKILRIYRRENIILHVIKGTEYYYDEAGNVQCFEPNVIDYFRRLNRMWSFMYAYMNKRFEGCIYIDVSSGYIADKKHVWGLSPIHFQKEYYEKVLEEINRNIV